MRRNIRARFWAEAGLAGLTAFFLALTLLWSEWIEAVFRVDPDGGSGAAEWAVVGVLAGATMVLSVLARAEWRRSAVGAT